MTLFQNLIGNIAEIPAAKAQKELAPVLVKGEEVTKAFRLFRDLIVMTNLRILTLDKQGVTGKKQALTSIPYKHIKKFAKESAGIFDLDAELRIWVYGDEEPFKWQFSTGVDINEVYQILSQYVLAAK